MYSSETQLGFSAKSKYSFLKTRFFYGNLHPKHGIQGSDGPSTAAHEAYRQIRHLLYGNCLAVSHPRTIHRKHRRALVCIKHMPALCRPAIRNPLRVLATRIVLQLPLRHVPSLQKATKEAALVIVAAMRLFAPHVAVEDMRKRFFDAAIYVQFMGHV